MANDLSKVGKKIYDSLGQPLVQCLDDKGITVEYLADKLQEELDASEVKTFQYKGEVIQSDPLVTWEIRQRARQDAHKLRGDYPSEKHQIKVEGDLPVRPLTDEQRLEVEAIKRVLKEQALKESLKK